MSKYRIRQEGPQAFYLEIEIKHYLGFMLFYALDSNGNILSLSDPVKPPDIYAMRYISLDDAMEAAAYFEHPDNQYPKYHEIE